MPMRKPMLGKYSRMLSESAARHAMARSESKPSKSPSSSNRK